MGKRIINLSEPATTLQEKMQEFLLFKQAQQSSNLTIKDYKQTFTHFVDHSHNTLDLDVLKMDTLNFFKSIPNTSPARYNVPFSNINAFFNWCVKQDYLEINPITKLGLKKRKDEGKIRSKDIEDIKAFIGVIETNKYTGLRDYTLILLMLDTGARPKELLSLTRKHIDIHSKMIEISKDIAKTRTSRILPLSPMTVKMLKKLLSVIPDDWTYVFSTYEGEYMDTRILDKRFDKYSKLSGIKITPYQLRHSFATLFLNNDGNLFALQVQMGHTDLRMTKRYISISKEKLAEQHSKASPVNMLKSSKVEKMKLF